MLTTRVLLSYCKRRSSSIFNHRNLKIDKHYSNLACISCGTNVKRCANFDIGLRKMMMSPISKSKGKTVRKVILSQCAPKPIGPYSQAVQFGNTLYVSGVLGLDKDKMELVGGGVENQAKQALVNLGHILKAAGTTYENVIKTSIFLSDIGNFKRVNEVYKEFFMSNPPARSTYQVGALPMGALVEIEVIAGTGEIEHSSCTCSSKM